MQTRASKHNATGLESAADSLESFRKHLAMGLDAARDYKIFYENSFSAGMPDNVAFEAVNAITLSAASSNVRRLELTKQKIAHLAEHPNGYAARRYQEIRPDLASDAIKAAEILQRQWRNIVRRVINEPYESFPRRILPDKFAHVRTSLKEGLSASEAVLKHIDPKYPMEKKELSALIRGYKIIWDAEALNAKYPNAGQELQASAERIKEEKGLLQTFAKGGWAK